MHSGKVLSFGGNYSFDLRWKFTFVYFADDLQQATTDLKINNEPLMTIANLKILGPEIAR